jgi:eukaryotic-like serine/threonine-protein kinase
MLAQAAGEASEPSPISVFSNSETHTTCDTSKESFPQPFGNYELLGRIGRGGMGVVYKARQVSLNRIVALKLLPYGALATKEQVLRFKAEAATAGSLQHPNIVAVHEVGLCEDRHFLVMDYVEGQTLGELARAGPLPPAQSARYIQKIAEAIHYAHERGILHRDLKPSNVLIDATDEPRITDFGLAKRLEAATDLTLSGQVLGSPQYMPPEQAAGRQRQVGRGSDVYSLGAMLYHLLTGRPPFSGETLADILPQVENDTPPRPKQIRLTVPPDLETICLKCLEKEVRRRYPSALALGQELGRFLRREPILARPIGTAGKTWRWCRRNPLLASAVGLVVSSLLLGLCGIVWEWHRAELQRIRAEANEYVLSMTVAQKALQENNSGRALELLERYWSVSQPKTSGPKSKVDPRGFEWRYLWQQCQSEADAVIGKLQLAVSSLDVSADGRWLFAGSMRAPPKVWDLATGKEAAFISEKATWGWGAFSPDARYLALADQGTKEGSFGKISVWDLQTRKRLAPIIDGRPVGALGFSRDGRRLGYLVLLPSPKGGAFAALDFLSRQKVCELVANTEVPDDRQHFDWVFSHDAENFIGYLPRFPGNICFWNLSSGEPRSYPAHSEGIAALAISPDGRVLATAGYTETTIRLWEIPSFQRLGDDLSGHKGLITALRFSPDGQLLASAAADQTIQLWDLPMRKQRWVVSRLPADVWRLCFAADGHKLFSGSADGTVQRWSVDGPLPKLAPSRLRAPGQEDITPDARRLAGLRQGRVWLGQAQDQTMRHELPELGTNNTCLIFSADGKRLFTGTENGEVQIYSLDSPKSIQRLRTTSEKVVRLLQAQRAPLLLAFHCSSDAPQPAMESYLRVQPWVQPQWQPQKSWTIAGSWGVYAISPDGQWFAADAAPGSIQIRRPTGAPQIKTLKCPGRICGITFSPDSRLLAVATREGKVKLWEVSGFREREEFRACAHGLSDLTFSPDSLRLATTGEGLDGIKLWDVATYQELITLPGGGEAFREIAFSADGDQLVGENSRGDLFFWRVPSFADIEK